MPVSFFAGAERMREEMKVLTVYFSKSGHTEKVARLIQEAAGGDLAEIRVKKGYTGSYWMTVIRGGLEKCAASGRRSSRSASIRRSMT